MSGDRPDIVTGTNVHVLYRVLASGYNPALRAVSADYIG
jgi:hypothetical protein